MLDLLQAGALIALCAGALPLIVVWLVSAVALGMMSVVLFISRSAARCFRVGPKLTNLSGSDLPSPRQ